VVMALKTRRDVFGGFSTNIKTPYIYGVSRMVSSFTGFVVPPNKAVVGKNAFRHESGIHQDAVLKQKSTYEIIDPKDVGFVEQQQLVLGKHSGRHALASRLKGLGFKLDDSKVNEIFGRFKELADKKKEVFDDDLVALVEVGTGIPRAAYKLVSVKVTTGTNIVPEAEVAIEHRKKVRRAVSTGDGPVDACYKAVDKISGVRGQLLEYRLDSVTRGKDAMGEATIKVMFKDRAITSRGASTDIIEASVAAYVAALNKYES
jgi:2-isopropylmalate synthase